MGVLVPEDINVFGELPRPDVDLGLLRKDDVDEEHRDGRDDCERENRLPPERRGEPRGEDGVEHRPDITGPGDPHHDPLHVRRSTSAAGLGQAPPLETGPRKNPRTTPMRSVAW